VGKATGARECAPDDRLRVPAIPNSRTREMVGTAQVRLCPPYNLKAAPYRTGAVICSVLSRSVMSTTVTIGAVSS
jgi:hypothetical protein